MESYISLHMLSLLCRPCICGLAALVLCTACISTGNMTSKTSKRTWKTFGKTLNNGKSSLKTWNRPEFYLMKTVSTLYKNLQNMTNIKGALLQELAKADKYIRGALCKNLQKLTNILEVPYYKNLQKLTNILEVPYALLQELAKADKYIRGAYYARTCKS